MNNDKMYYTVYKITNTINNKIYVGIHRTYELDDGYMGSGIHLKRSQKKYGIENFTKEIIHIFYNPDDMYAMESEIVNEEFVADVYNYNLITGGKSGFPLNLEHTQNGRISADSILKEKYGNDFRTIISKMGVDARIALLRENPEYYREMFYKRGEQHAFYGKKHTDETKDKMSKSHKERLKDPTNNSQYGTMWIYNAELKINKKINKHDDIPDGWKRGRKVKHVD